MMARIARLVISNCPHHVTQRGNYRQEVFSSRRDREMYLEILRDHCRRHEVRLLAWCLMTNHVHLVAVPPKEQSLARALGRTHNEYARWRHVGQRQSGHLWQNRFHSCPLEEAHWWETMRYVEVNPVRAGLVNRAWDWEWSSAQAHVTGVDRFALLDFEEWSRRYDHAGWREVLELGHFDAALAARIREATRTGRPFGEEEFIKRIEKETGRVLHARKRGPKPKPLAPGSGG